MKNLRINPQAEVTCTPLRPLRSSLQKVHKSEMGASDLHGARPRFECKAAASKKPCRTQQIHLSDLCVDLCVVSLMFLTNLSLL